MNNISLYISITSLCVAIFALGWNFYRDVLLKPRIKGHIQISYIFHVEEKLGPYISLSFVNHGPGQIILESIFIAQKSILRFLGPTIANLLKKQTKWAHITHDYTNPYSGKLPKKLQVGEKLDLFLNCNQKAFLALNPTHVGIRDSFGRFHCVNQNQLAIAKKEFFQDFSVKQWKSK